MLGLGVGVSPRAPPDPLSAGLTANERLVYTMIVPAMPKMKKQANRHIQAHLIRSTVYLLVLVAMCSIPFVLAERNATKPEAPTKFSQRTLTFAERVAYQRAIEEVYWRHRIWPKDRPDSKPSLDAGMSQAQLEKKVADYLRNSQALEDYWQQPITPEQLQAEMDRIAQHTKQPEVLRELFAVLGNDPFVIAECLARPVLAERRARELHARDGSASDRKQNGATAVSNAVSEDQRAYYAAAVPAQYTLPAITSAPNGCDDTWTPTNVPVGVTPRANHTAVWTGTEMIVWGGNNVGYNPPEGGRYNPATDSWTATSTTNAPVPRNLHTAVWTGTEMIVWGGHDPTTNMPVNSGGRYNPATDTWIPTNTNIWVRELHTAIWTGTEMIEWGGYDPLVGSTNTGARYNPATDSWTATSTTNAPDARYIHTAVWTNSEMIVWGGDSNGHGLLNTGGRYNPATDTWTATNFNNAPDPRIYHTAVWTGSEMIIWGGYDEFSIFNTGGRYNPTTNSWVATNTTNAPEARLYHTAVPTGSEMIVWGGNGATSTLNTGGRYNPSTDSWTDTTTNDAPEPRFLHTAVWTGSEMIVWGGADAAGNGLATGGRYCGQTGPTPTPTPTATPTPTVSPTPTATPTPTPTPTPCTGRCNPTPRPRPTPHRRPTPH